MASDMSGYQGEEGKKRWKQESGGDDAAYNREMAAWNSSKVLGQQGTGTQEQRDTATQKAGTYSDDSADAGSSNTGDAYLDELRSGRVAGSEDWRRFSNAQLKAWEGYYVGGGKFRNKYGDIVDKPDDVGPNTPQGYNGTGDFIGGGGGVGGGGGGGGGGARPQAAPAAPAAPTTFGNQLSYTGNPLTDMLLYQFNTGSQLSDPSKMNTFAMGQDRAEGGVGANADQQKRQGQLLQGGGLWWSDSGTDAFGGFRADQKNANAANPNPAAPAPAPSSPQNTSPASSPAAFATPMNQQQGGLSIPKVPQAETGISPMAGMMAKTWRQAAGSEDSPFEKRAF